MAADKGLRKDAISFPSNVAIALSSTSPAYSLAATIGPVIGLVSVATPGVMILAFLPMLCIAVACQQLNRLEPDCGTSFAWVRRALGPAWGWITGWSIIVANILIMPSLADISGRYSLRLLGVVEPSALAVGCTGVAWIVVLTATCYLGITLSARMQMALLVAEFAILALFAVVALTEAGTASAAAQPFGAGWLNPFLGNDLAKVTQALVLAVFIYWGWDSCISVNEETTDPATTPGRAAVVSTVILVAVYALVAVAVVGVATPAVLAENSSDVLGPLGTQVLGAPLDRLLVLAVLSSAIASTQTSILPSARMALSMAHAGAIPEHFGRVHPRHLTPGVATVAMGVVSTLWYVGMTLISSDVLTDSIAALGLVVAFYYGLTGIACVAVHRRTMLRSVRAFVMTGLIPGVGAVMMAGLLVQSCLSPGASQTSFAGVAGPVVVAIGAVVVGGVLMLVARVGMPGFFRQRAEAAAD
jgi:amino acid transporter